MGSPCGWISSDKCDANAGGFKLDDNAGEDAVELR